MRYTQIIYDIDGTLVDTETTGVRSLMQTVKELMDREMTYDEAYPYFGIPSAKVGPMLGHPDNVQFLEVWEEHFTELRHLIQPFPGVIELMEEVHRSGVSTGVVTSRSHKEMELDPLLNSFLPFLDHVVCAEDSPRPKPFPDPMFKYMELEYAATGHQVSPRDCIFIGDTEHDWRSAHDAGIDFALADWRGKGMQGIPAEHVFTDADGLRKILGL